MSVAGPHVYFCSWPKCRDSVAKPSKGTAGTVLTSMASEIAVCSRPKCRVSAAKPPKDRGDWIPDASPTGSSRSKGDVSGESRYVVNRPNRMRWGSRSSKETPCKEAQSHNSYTFEDAAWDIHNLIAVPRAVP